MSENLTKIIPGHTGNSNYKGQKLTKIWFETINCTEFLAKSVSINTQSRNSLPPAQCSLQYSTLVHMETMSILYHSLDTIKLYLHSKVSFSTMDPYWGHTVQQSTLCCA